MPQKAPNELYMSRHLINREGVFFNFFGGGGRGG